MGYKYKNIDDRRQEAPFLILEKNIYQNLNVSTLAEVVDTYTGGCKLKSVPKGIYFESNYAIDGVSVKRGDLVLVIFLDNYGTDTLTKETDYIMHDYKNAVVIGKVSSL